MKVFISAAEPSGDLIAAEVMDCLPKGTTYIGIGGVEMQNRGLQTLFPMQELSVMGFLEIIPRLFNILKRIRQTVDVIIKEQPDVVLTVDAYSFHSRLVSRLRKRGYKGRLCHYVPPAVWAWKKKRAQALAQLYNEVYCIFPFEPPYFQPHGIHAEFVGHPAAFRVYKKDPTFRDRYNLSNAPILMLLPGSRLQEIEKLYEDFLKTSQMLAKTHPNLQLVVPTLPHLVPKIEEISSHYKLKVTVITDTHDRFTCFQEAQAALAASGTVAMELALNKVPCVIGYKTSALTYFLARQFAKVKYITILNIMADREVISEFLQDQCTPENLAAALTSCLRHEDRARVVDEIEAYTNTLKASDGQKPQQIVAKRLEFFSN
ncbi:MAG: lipid-A-disaccharide synthase [Candidatus Paracaedibacteraceae bacterium]|nr:lipid-A-disaccharide synthase [Candidatus Paracaedibacteraceae bacterium]